MRPDAPFPVIMSIEPPELLVADELTPCPYIEGLDARMPLRLPIRPLRRREWDDRLAQGDRRHGAVLYRTLCPTCSACEPIRVDVKRFDRSRNHRRVVRKASERITMEIARPQMDVARLDLYEKHLTGRGLRIERNNPITPERYRSFLVDSCCDTLEFRYFDGGRLVGVAVVDRALRSLSAHYTYYDPDLSMLSLGTFSILKQIELCQRWNLDYLYLGLYIAENRSMSYKSRFRPHERLIGGQWQGF